METSGTVLGHQHRLRVPRSSQCHHRTTSYQTVQFRKASSPEFEVQSLDFLMSHTNSELRFSHHVSRIKHFFVIFAPQAPTFPSTCDAVQLSYLAVKETRHHRLLIHPGNPSHSIAASSPASMNSTAVISLSSHVGLGHVYMNLCSVCRCGRMVLIIS